MVAALAGCGSSSMTTGTAGAGGTAGQGGVPGGNGGSATGGNSGGVGPDASVTDGPAGDASKMDTGPVTPPTTCGGAGQVCCAGNACSGDGCCAGGKCVAAGSSCAPLEGTCAAGSCGTCGGPGQPCCANATCTAPLTRCNGSGTGAVCAKCGSFAGDVCCLPTGTNPNNPPYYPYATGVCPGTGVVCDNTNYSGGRCTACGGPGQPCCAGASCSGGGCCYDNKCINPGENCVSG